VDPPYAETMIRVQRDWHFAYLLAGRNTMIEMIKREKDPPTLLELAGFYRSLGQWPLAAEYYRKAIAAVPADDVLARVNERERLAVCLERGGDRDGAVRELLETAAELVKADTAPGAKPERFTGQRLKLAGALTAMDRPWDAWKLAAPAAKALSATGPLSAENAERLAGILLSMRELDEGGKRPADASESAARELEDILVRSMGPGFFKEQDPLHSVMAKYSNLAVIYAARNGRAYALERLLAPGPLPAGNRPHHRRGNPTPAVEAEDWKWIRLSVPAYIHFFSQALDQRKPVAGRRTDEAVRILAALEKALPEIEKLGSMSNMEFALLAIRVQRDAITKNWAGMDETFRMMKRRNWAQLYRLVAMSLGDAAEYMTPAEFEQQFRKFCDQSPPLPHYFRAVYGALSKDCPQAALAAARITAERFPDNPDVQNEYRLLQEHVAQRFGPGGGAPVAPKGTPVEAR